MYVLLLSIMALGRIVECFIAKYRKEVEQYLHGQSGRVSRAYKNLFSVEQ